MTATIHNIRDYTLKNNQEWRVIESLADRRYWPKHVADALSHLCPDYCGQSPCKCYPGNSDLVAFAKEGEPKVPA